MACATVHCIAIMHAGGREGQAAPVVHAQCPPTTCRHVMLWLAAEPAADMEQVGQGGAAAPSFRMQSSQTAIAPVGGSNERCHLHALLAVCCREAGLTLMQKSNESCLPTAYCGGIRQAGEVGLAGGPGAIFLQPRVRAETTSWWPSHWWSVWHPAAGSLAGSAGGCCAGLVLCSCWVKAPS